MIAYERIRKKPQVEQVAEAVGFSLDATPSAIEAERLRRQQQLADGEKPTGDLLWRPQPQRSDESAIGMGKLQYAQWLNRIVYPKFQKGSMVTLANEPFVLNQAPRIWFTIGEIQEIHYMAMIDRETRDPKCIGLITSMHHRIPTWYPPAKLRALQPEEIKAIDSLRNQAQDSTQSKPSVTPNGGTEGTKPSSGLGGIDGEGRQEEGNI